MTSVSYFCVHVCFCYICDPFFENSKYGFVCVPTVVLSVIYGFVCTMAYHSSFSKMDPSRFYGCSKHVNPIPGDGFLSDDDLVSDSDPEYEPSSSRLPKKRHILIPESDSESSDDNIPLQKLQSNKKRVKNSKKTLYNGNLTKWNHTIKITSYSWETQIYRIQYSN